MRMAATILVLFFFTSTLSSTLLAASHTAHKNNKKPLYWVAPMDSHYRRNAPGKSPMGMDLVPVYQQTSNNNVISISAHMIESLGVKTVTIKKERLIKEIHAVGHVTYNEAEISHLHLYVAGWIKKLYVNKNGTFVHKGEPLMAIYSPILLQAQDELLLAQKNQQPALFQAAINKLSVLGVSQKQINQLIHSKKAQPLININAPQTGIVTDLSTRTGMYVSPNKNVMTIVNLQKIWLLAHVFARQSSWLKVGQHATATTRYYPSLHWNGTVDFIYPELDQQTHSIKVRLVFNNPKIQLKPGMYAKVLIKAEGDHLALVAPKDAVIRTGDKDRVILSLGHGEFIAKPVTIGTETADSYEILSGLKAGDVVVTQAQFLIDSEASKHASLNRLSKKEIKLSPKKPPQKKTLSWKGKGEIQSVNRKKYTVLINHEPMPKLKWPAMTMQLAVDKKVNLSNIKANDQVHFTLVKEKNGGYKITGFDVINNPHQHQHHH